MNVQEFMSTNIESIDADKSVYDAVEKMVNRRIRSLLVRFSGPKTEYGVITARDVVFRVLARDIDPQTMKASAIASRPLVCIDRYASLHEASVMMEESNVARLFVCDGGKILGMLSLLDFMAAMLILRARGSHDSH